MVTINKEKNLYIDDLRKFTQSSITNIRDDFNKIKLFNEYKRLCDSNKVYKPPEKIKTVFAYGSINKDHRTQKEYHGKGASAVIYSRRVINDGFKMCILLGLEKPSTEYTRKYAHKFNLFGGHRESYDKTAHETVCREVGEEYSSKILKWIKWCGSPWAFYSSHIEFGTVSSLFDIDKSFIENNEMAEAQWFPIENMLNGIEHEDRDSYSVKDINGNNRDITCYAHGVIMAAQTNGHF